jgi:hypothetical protein
MSAARQALRATSQSQNHLAVFSGASRPNRVSDELTTAEWNEAKKLLILSDVQLHQLRLVELRAGADLLRVVSDLCKQRSRALLKFVEGRSAIGEVE